MARLRLPKVRRKRRARGAEKEAPEELKPEVWERLSNPLALKVLEFVAWRDVLCFRTVCKEWNLFLDSEPFKSGWRRSPDQQPLCFMSSKAVNSFFNPAIRQWHLLNPKFLPSIYSKGLPRCSDNIMQFHVLSAARGFLLVQLQSQSFESDEDYSSSWPVEDSDDELDLFPSRCVTECESSGSETSTPGAHGSETLLIVNPLEKQCVRTVPFFQDNYCQHEIVWDPEACSYELLARSADMRVVRGSRCIWILGFHRFDFEEGAWEEIMCWYTHRLICIDSSCLIGGELVCLGRGLSSDNTPSSTPYRIYGTQLPMRDSIEEMEQDAPQFPFPLGFAVLFHFEGEFVVAGGDTSARYAPLESFKVWKKRDLFCKEEEWEEVGRMPLGLVSDLNQHPKRSFHDFSCRASEGFVCVSNRACKVVMFDLKTGAWWRLPPHPFGVSGAAEGMALCDPRFDVVFNH